MYKTGLFLFVFAGSMFADIAVTVDARKDLQLTVYRDFGVVRDIRKINIPEGGNRIRFEGVATGINAESVNLDWVSGVGIELIGQSYEFDLVSPQKLMEKYVGKEIEIIPSKNLWPDTTIQTAELISINGKEPVYRIGTKITFGDIGRVLFPYMPDNLYTKPTLVWNVFIPKRQETEIAANYLTEGISWKAAYLLIIDKTDEVGSFGGWITFNNESGLDCKNAQITFVAGDVRRIREKKMSAVTSGDAVKNLQQYGDYYFYAMNQRVTLLSNHSNQVEWIPRGQVNLNQSYYVEVNSDAVAPLSINVFSAIEVVNDSSNGLGIPLPEGIVRVFKRDANNDNRFIGENRISKTNPGSTFIVPIGKSDGISAVRKSLSNDTYMIEITNRKNRQINLKLSMDVNGKILTDASKQYRKLDDASFEWDITIKSKESFKLTYTLKRKS
jgi:hypothetical protein